MTDIDEVNNVIQETDEEAYEETYALDFNLQRKRNIKQYRNMSL